MSLYAYQGRAADGHAVRGWTEADSPKAARAALAAEGVLTEHLAPAPPPTRLPAAARAALYNALGVLLGAGFTLEQALGLLAGESGGGDAAPLALHLRDRIRDGAAFSDALTDILPNLPPFERAALRAAERAGHQGGMLEALASFIEAERAAAERVRAALLYPLAVLALATGLLALMVYVILPRAMDVFAKTGDALPRSARLLAVWGPRGMTLFLAALAGAALAVAFARARARTDAAAGAAFERLLARLPFSRRLLPLLWAQRFTGTMALLVGAGVAPQSAFAAAGEATGSAWLSTLSATAAADVKGGASLSQATRRLTPIAALVADWVQVGESAGSLEKMLQQASARCRQTYETTLARLLGLLEPALIVAVGLVVLAVTVAVLRPMLQLATGAI